MIVHISNNQILVSPHDLLQQDTIVFSLEPFLSVGFCDLVSKSNSGLLSATVCNIVSWSSQHNVEIHSVDTNTWIILNSKIDMFCNTEAKVSSGREVSLSQFVFLHFQSFLKDFFSFGSPYCAVNCNFFITTNAKRSPSVSSLGENRSLSGEGFEDLSGTNKSVTTFTNTDVDAHLLDANLLHFRDNCSCLGFCHFYWLMDLAQGSP